MMRFHRMALETYARKAKKRESMTHEYFALFRSVIRRSKLIPLNARYNNSKPIKRKPVNLSILSRFVFKIRLSKQVYYLLYQGK